MKTRSVVPFLSFLSLLYHSMYASDIPFASLYISFPRSSLNCYVLSFASSSSFALLSLAPLSLASSLHQLGYRSEPVVEGRWTRIGGCSAVESRFFLSFFLRSSFFALPPFCFVVAFEIKKSIKSNSIHERREKTQAKRGRRENEKRENVISSRTRERETRKAIEEGKERKIERENSSKTETDRLTYQKTRENQKAR